MSFSHDLLLPISGIVEVNGGNLDVRVKNVLIGKDSTVTIMSHIKVTRQELVLEVLDCLLQSSDGPFHRDVFLDGTFFPPSGAWIPALNAEPPLLD